tara:strand:- start:1137 stop:1427 length:291 start_codon:yes stop_codon:yes gene_type:complete
MNNLTKITPSNHDWLPKEKKNTDSLFKQKKELMSLYLSSSEILCATDEEEFYYKANDQPVSEGDPIGVDIENEELVELVLFSNVYWKPNYERLRAK